MISRASVRRNSHSRTARNASRANSQTSKLGQEVTACDSGSGDRGLASLLLSHRLVTQFGVTRRQRPCNLPQSARSICRCHRVRRVSRSSLPRIASQDAHGRPVVSSGVAGASQSSQPVRGRSALAVTSAGLDRRRRFSQSRVGTYFASSSSAAVWLERARRATAEFDDTGRPMPSNCG